MLKRYPLTEGQLQIALNLNSALQEAKTKFETSIGMVLAHYTDQPAQFKSAGRAEGQCYIEFELVDAEGNPTTTKPELVDGTPKETTGKS